MRMYVRLALIAIILGSVGGAFYLGIKYGQYKSDSVILAERDTAFEKLLKAEAELEELRKERSDATNKRIRVIRKTVDVCADTVPADDINRMLDESDKAGR